MLYRVRVESRILLDRPTLTALNGHETISLKVRPMVCADKLDRILKEPLGE